MSTIFFHNIFQPSLPLKFDAALRLDWDQTQPADSVAGGICFVGDWRIVPPTEI